jgi:hypothetical protein
VWQTSLASKLSDESVDLLQKLLHNLVSLLLTNKTLRGKVLQEGCRQTGSLTNNSR